MSFVLTRASSRKVSIFSSFSLVRNVGTNVRNKSVKRSKVLNGNDLIKAQGNHFPKAYSELIKMIEKNSACIRSFNAVMRICSSNGLSSEALQLLGTMEVSGVSPNATTLSHALTACVKNKQWNKTIELFENFQMKNPTVKPDTLGLVYALALRGYANTAQWEKALEIFNTMLDNNITPNVFTCNQLVFACDKGKQWSAALEVLDIMRDRALSPDVVTFSSAISACSKSGKWQEALQVFDQMILLKVNPNVFTFNSLIRTFGIAGQWQLALDKFFEMESTYQLQPDLRSFNMTMHACEMSGQTKHVLDLLKLLLERNNIEPDVITFSTAINGCAKSHDWEAMFRVYEYMITQTDVVPDLGILNNVLQGYIDQEKWIEMVDFLDPSNSSNPSRNKLDHFHYHTAINALLEDAHDLNMAIALLEMMEKKAKKIPNVIAVSRVMSACCSAGRGAKALELFDSMLLVRGKEVDLTSFNTAIDACKLIESEVGGRKALQYFHKLPEHNIQPDFITFSVLIDVLERCGDMRREANEVLSKAIQEGFFKTVWQDNDAAPLTLDLHTCTGAVARTVLRLFIDETLLEKVKHAKKNGTELTQSSLELLGLSRDVIVITGQGNHTNPKYKPVLPPHIRKLVSELDIPITEVSGNPGRFVLKSEDIFSFIVRRVQKGE